MQLSELKFDHSDLSSVAKQLVQDLSLGTVVLLEGEMGAGKTTLVRALCDALGGYEGVTSPTFNLVNAYDGEPTIYHMDLYRLRGEGDVLSLDLDRYFSDKKAVSFVEWPERLGQFLPERFERWTLSFVDGESETVRCLVRDTGSL